MIYESRECTDFSHDNLITTRSKLRKNLKQYSKRPINTKKHFQFITIKTHIMNSFSLMKDAFRQIFWRMISAISGFLVVSMMTPLLWPLRYGDYTTILNYFALWSALADLWLYVIWLRELGNLKAQYNITNKEDFEHISPKHKEDFSIAISQFVWSRIWQIIIVYSIAIMVAYLIPSYYHNPYIAWWLPLWMAFSALFMVAGIIQLPLQLFWKMEQVSIALVLARIAQIITLIFIAYSGVRTNINPENIPIALFLAVVGSVTISSITQTLYTYIMWNRIITLRRTPFFHHMVNHIKSNGKYGAAFFLSSFHLLIVSLLISILYPTIKWFTYIGIRWLSLQLIQILLIIPAALANSLIHGISWSSLTKQRKSFWHMINILIRFGRICISNFFVFSSSIISFVSWKEYLTSHSPFNTQWVYNLITWRLYNNEHITIWADYIIPGLSIVLAMSFIKTIFNYVFVAAKKQNVLFPINLRWVTIGWLIAYFAVQYYNIIGWLFAQILMEAMFLWGALIYAKKHNILPTIFYKDHLTLHIFFIIITTIGSSIIWFDYTNFMHFFIAVIIFNTLIVSLRYKYIKSEFKSISSQINNKDLENSYWSDI